MFQTLKNAWSMPELRKKMLYTLFIILIFRFGSCIPVPFIDTALLSQYFEQASVNGSMLGYLDMFTGGGLSRATIFAMSITPYINASIILQLLTVAIPALERMVKDGGEEGRKKIARWTRYVGVLLGLLQGLSYYALHPGSVRKARSWPQDVRRSVHPPADQGQCVRRYADHLRIVHPVPAADHFDVLAPGERLGWCAHS